MYKIMTCLQALFVIAAASGSLAQEPAIPDVFHGVWQPVEAGKVASCLPKDADIRQTIAGDRIDFSEGICWVQTSAVVNADSVRLGLRCDVEGTESENSQEWRLQQIGDQRQLFVNSLDPDMPYESFLAQCSGATSASALDETASRVHEGLCYRQDLAGLDVLPQADGTFRISVESAQANAHICGFEGPGTKTNDGFLFSERLDDGTECTLTVRMDDLGNVSFQDPGYACTRYYCGARAAFDAIAFSAKERRPCQ